MLKRLLLLLAILAPCGLKAQNFPISGSVQVNSSGTLRPVPSALITVCSGTITTLPCFPTVQPIFNVLGGTVPNPFNADVNGNYLFFVSAAGTYTITISGVGVQTYNTYVSAGTGSTGAVTSVFGRAGVVVATSGDYTCTLVTNCPSTTGTNTWTGVQTFKGPNPWIDGTAYGMRTFAVFNTINVTTSGGLGAVTSTGVGDFIINDGIVIPKAGPATAVVTPAAPTVTNVGATGSASVSYECKAIDKNWGMSAESPATTINTVPTVFGAPATQISTISRAANVVTVVTTGAMPFSAGTFHAVITNITGAATQFSGLQLVTMTNATTLTYNQTGPNESGTVQSPGSYVLFKNAFIVTTAQATAGSNQIVLTTDINHNIPFISSGSRPIRVYVDGIKFAAASIPGYANGTTGVAAAVGANTLTIATPYTSPITTTGVADINSATSAVAQMTVTNIPVIDVACPAISGTTVQYAVYANYGSGFNIIGITPWGANILEDYGPAYTQSQFVSPPAMNLPATPSGAAQNQVYAGQITNIVGNNLTVTPVVPTTVTGVTAQHDSSAAFGNALAASCLVAGLYSVYLPQPQGAFGYYLFSAPFDMTSPGCNRANVLQGGAVYLNGTMNASGLGYLEWKRPWDVSEFNTFSNGSTSGGQMFIFGNASPQMLSPGTAMKMKGIQFNTQSNGGIGLEINGGSNVELTDDTFETAGSNNMTSIPLFIFNAGFGIQLHNITFIGNKNWQYPVSDPNANNEVGDPCYWPVPAVDITGSFSPKFKMDGINYGIYRGLQWDALYPNLHTNVFIEIDDVDTFQAPQQSLVTVYGASVSVDQMKITRSVMDSVGNSLTGCVSTASAPCAATFVSEWNFGGNMLSGAPYRGATEISSTTIPTQNTSDSFNEGAFVNETVICSGTYALSTALIANNARTVNSYNTCPQAGAASAINSNSDHVDCTFVGDPNGVTGYAASTPFLTLRVYIPTGTGAFDIDQINQTGAGVTPGALSMQCAVKRP